MWLHGFRPRNTRCILIAFCCTFGQRVFFADGISVSVFAVALFRYCQLCCQIYLCCTPAVAEIIFAPFYAACRFYRHRQRDAILVYQCIRGQAPVYLADSLQPVAQIPGRQRLRSSSTSALSVPLIRLRAIGDRAFPVAAAKAWNSLPAEMTSARSLQTFKSKLKSHLFSVSFL